MTRKLLRAAMAATAVTGSVLLMFPGAAFAGHDDSFKVRTTDSCGGADFVDYGPGAPGGGDNDDYIVIHDYCGDGYGVSVDVWRTGEFWSRGYNGAGSSGAAVIWDPFAGANNVRAGEEIGIKVCLAHGKDDWSGAKCQTKYHTSVDG
ncbi:hypothetical protein [Krasilnikovia sp. M28-CT-15]|uniref:hypothetical protein n=1 Tax=Krasilnikovia sp. M28-CT-15 TaxID=3373540 RepID=UPI0038771EAC